MADITHITYLFDPLCGWCYGASAMLQKLAARPDVAIYLLRPAFLPAITAARWMKVLRHMPGPTINAFPA